MDNGNISGKEKLDKEFRVPKKKIEDKIVVYKKENELLKSKFKTVLHEFDITKLKVTSLESRVATLTKDMRYYVIFLLSMLILAILY